MPLAAQRDHERDRKDGPQLVVGGERVGTTLRRAREAFGQDLKSVSAGLRIRHVYLEAIEAGQFEKLPGPTYAIGFVRAYADFLGLDTDEILRRFKDEVHGLERKTNLVFPSAVPEKKIPGGAIILISVLLAGVVYGGWMYLSNQGKDVGDLIPSVAESIRSLTGRDDAAETPPGATAGGETQARSGESAAPQGAAPASNEPGVAMSTPAPEPALEPTSTPTRPPAAESSASAAVAEAPEPAAPANPETALTPPEPETASPTLADAAEMANRSLPESSPASPSPTPSTLPDIFGAPADQQTPLSSGDSGAMLPPGATDIEPPSAEIEESGIPAVPAGSGGSTTPEDFTGEDVPRVYGETNRNARVVVRATQDAWVQIQDADRNLLLTRVLRAGDSYLVPDQPGITLLTGNAGGLKIVVDGRTLAPLGPVGSVRREIELDPQRLLDGTAYSR
ncbi:MAG: helix-turn-helix domain-containing protein [Kiloniellales bacterium]